MAANHCTDHDKVRADSTEALATVRIVKDQLDLLVKKVDRLSRQMWIWCGVTATLAAVITPGIKTLWDRVVPTAAAQEVPIDPQAIEQAVSSGSTWAIVGAGLMLLSILARNATRGAISEQWEKLVSAVTTVLVVVGGMLIAGAEPLRALTVGMVAIASSSGFVDALRAVIKNRASTAVIILACAVPVSSGCGAGISPCTIGRTSLGVAISATQPAVAAIPDEARRDEAVVYVEAAQRIADALVDGCDSIEGADYFQLFGESTRLLGGVLAILEHSGVRVPPALRAVLEAFGIKGALPVLQAGGQNESCDLGGGDGGDGDDLDGMP